MERSFPDRVDSSVVGFGVTYWVAEDRKFLIQHSPREPRPCFKVTESGREKITPKFDPNDLYEMLVRCVVSTTLREAGNTEFPSMDIGISYESVKVYANVPLNDDSFNIPAVRALKEYLEDLIRSV